MGVGFDFSEEGGKDAYALQNKVEFNDREVQESDGRIDQIVDWVKTYGMFGRNG